MSADYRYAAGIHGLSSTPDGTACGRAMLLGVSSLLQTAASAWIDDDVASAVAELLYRSLELAPDVSDELFTWMAAVISSLHAHHAATACGVVEQLAGRWGVDASAAAAAWQLVQELQSYGSAITGRCAARNRQRNRPRSRD